MAIYLWGCTKGGVGKSTMAVNCAAMLALEQRRVCVVDADWQRHSSAWCLTRRTQTLELPAVPDKIADGPIAQMLVKWSAGFDDLVVDAGGRDSKELRSAMRVCDVLLIPFVASAFDLYAVEVMDELIDGARAYNEKLKVLAFVNKAATNWVQTRAAQAALEFIDSFPSMRRAETLVHQRTPFSNSIDSGRSVAELGLRGTKAADEFATLMAEAQALISGDVHARATEGVSSTAEAAEEVPHAMGERGRDRRDAPS